MVAVGILLQGPRLNRWSSLHWSQRLDLRRRTVVLCRTSAVRRREAAKATVDSVASTKIMGNHHGDLMVI